MTGTHLSDKDKQQALKKRFEKLKEKAGDQPFENDELKNNTGILPAGDLKKFLGCGG